MKSRAVVIIVASHERVVFGPLAISIFLFSFFTFLVGNLLHTHGYLSILCCVDNAIYIGFSIYFSYWTFNNALLVSLSEATSTATESGVRSAAMNWMTSAKKRISKVSKQRRDHGKRLNSFKKLIRQSAETYSAIQRNETNPSSSSSRPCIDSRWMIMTSLT